MINEYHVKNINLFRIKSIAFEIYTLMDHDDDAEAWIHTQLLDALLNLKTLHPANQTIK